MNRRPQMTGEALTRLAVVSKAIDRAGCKVIASGMRYCEAARERGACRRRTRRRTPARAGAPPGPAPPPRRVPSRSAGTADGRRGRDGDQTALVEHLADDHASARYGRQAVATAIVQLADRALRHALGAGTRAVERVRRMLTPPARPRILHRLVAASAIGLLLTGPSAVGGPAGECARSSPSIYIDRCLY